MSEGYLSLWRCLMDKPIWKSSTPEQKTVLITILMLVNHKENKWEWQGDVFNVLPGQCITSLESIKKAAGKGISIQNIRTSLKRFKKFDFLTNESTKQGRLITVINWSSYQQKRVKPTKKTTVSQQRPNKGLTPNNNVIMKEVKIYGRVVDYLNKKTGKHFKPNSKETVILIDARQRDGYTPENFKTVIDNKVLDCKNNEFEHKYLRPQTLFGTKFESYLNQISNPVNGNTPHKLKTLAEREAEEKELFANR